MSEGRHPNPAIGLWRATVNALSGLCAACRHERAFREEVAVLVVVAPLGLWLGETGVERALLVGSWLLVMVVELLNSGIEAAIDRVGKERHELSGLAKDLGAAAVFCSIVLAIVVWLLVLTDH